MKHISFFFGYLSPFAFFAWRRLPELQALGSVELVPVPMGRCSIIGALKARERLRLSANFC